MAQAKYKHLYNSKQWQQLRLQAFIRDLYICQQCNKTVSQDHTHRHAAIGNHIVKHNGDRVLFYDLDNIETVCKQCHDGHIQSIEKGGKGIQPIGLDGWPSQ